MEYFDTDILTIDTCVLEAEMNVMNAMYDHCQKLMMMYEYDTSDDSNCEMFMEASFGKTVNTNNTNNANKGTLGSKIKAVFFKMWDLIKQFFRWIGKMIGRAIGFVKSLFTKTKKPASADQCAKEAGIQPASNNSNRNTTNRKSNRSSKTAQTTQESSQPNQPAQSVQPIQNSNKKHLSRTNRKFKLYRQKTPNDKPVAIELDIPTITKDIFVSYDSNGNIAVDFHFARKLNLGDKDASDYASSNPKYIKGKQNAPDVSLFYLFIFSSDSSFFDHIEKWIIEMNDIINHKITDSGEIERCKTVCTNNYNVLANEIEDQSKSFEYARYGITMDQLTYAQKRVNKLLDLMMDFTISDELPQFDKEFLTIISAYVSLINGLQMGLNIVTNAILTSYTIDESYVGQCNDTETLSKFVTSLIDHGIPSKFVGYNIFLIMNKNWTGSDPKTDEFRPLWGQSRIVFKPTDKPDIVHKVALSNFGVQGNKNEQYIYKRVSGISELAQYFGKVEYTSSNGIVLDMERLDTDKSPDQDVANNISDNINELIKKYNIDIRVDDIHPGNLSKSRSGNYAILDYGWLVRT